MAPDDEFRTLLDPLDDRLRGLHRGLGPGRVCRRRPAPRAAPATTVARSRATPGAAARWQAPPLRTRTVYRAFPSSWPGSGSKASTGRPQQNASARVTPPVFVSSTSEATISSAMFSTNASGTIGLTPSSRSTRRKTRRFLPHTTRMSASSGVRATASRWASVSGDPSAPTIARIRNRSWGKLSRSRARRFASGPCSTSRTARAPGTRAVHGRGRDANRCQGPNGVVRGDGVLGRKRRGPPEVDVRPVGHDDFDVRGDAAAHHRSRDEACGARQHRDDRVRLAFGDDSTQRRPADHVADPVVAWPARRPIGHVEDQPPQPRISTGHRGVEPREPRRRTPAQSTYRSSTQTCDGARNLSERLAQRLRDALVAAANAGRDDLHLHAPDCTARARWCRYAPGNLARVHWHDARATATGHVSATPNMDPVSDAVR